MNNFRRQQLRGGFVTLITALLLVVSVAFSVIGYAASDGTKQQLEAVESRYTTIGAMNDQNSSVMQQAGTYLVTTGYGPGMQEWQWWDQNYERLEDGSIRWDDGTMFLSSTVLEAVASSAPQIRTISRSGILSAHVDGIYGLTSGTQNRLQYNNAFDNYGYNMAVLVLEDFHYGGNGFSGVDIRHPEGFRYLLQNFFFDAERGIEKIVSAHPRYQKLLERNSFRATDWEAITIIADPDGGGFESGKKYILRMFVNCIPIVQVERKVDGKTVYSWENYSAVRDEVGRHFNDRQIYTTLCGDFTTRELFSVTDVTEQAGVGQKNFTLDIKNVKKMYGELEVPTQYYYYGIPDDSLPFFAEVPGTLEEFLNSEEGRVWRDEIIPMAEINQQSATVMLVEDLDYLHAFNSGKAIIVDGRAIEASEFVRGDKVCVVSAAYADYAGLEVGDSINLDFYDTGYFLTSANVEYWDKTVSEFAMTHNPLQESNSIGYAQDYTIVGIYSAPEYEFGTTNFYADTIFVPKASVPNAQEYEDPSLPLLNSVVLMNGTAEEFEEYMESQGFGGYYTYFDKDYSSTIAGLQSLSQNALRLVILAGAVLIVTAILFYYLNFKRMIPVAYGMRRMGQHPFMLWWQMETVTIPVVLIAVFGGAYLGVYFFEYVTMELFETNIILDMEAVNALALLGAAVLSGISMLAAIPISVPRLMKRK